MQGHRPTPGTEPELMRSGPLCPNRIWSCRRPGCEQLHLRQRMAAVERRCNGADLLVVMDLDVSGRRCCVDVD